MTKRAMALVLVGVLGCGDGEAFVVAPEQEAGLDADDAANDDARGEADAAPTDAKGETDAATDGADADAGPPADARVDGRDDARGDEVDAPCDAPVFCYRDDDGDGYVVVAGAFAFCGACPSGARVADPTTEKLDCDDADPSVHPGVTTFSSTAYCVPGTACGKRSFDYDCDGVETQEFTAIATTCAVAGSGCSGEGWVAAAAPDCGVSAPSLACTRDLLACKASTSTVAQACR